MINTTAQLDLDFNKLPAKLQDFILSQEVADTVNLIAEEYDISDEQFDEFVLSISGLMIGTITSDHFLEIMKETFHLEAGQPTDILLDINETLLEPLSYLLSTIPDQATAPETTVEQSLPAISQSQEPVAALIEDHEHLATHTHDGPVPLSKTGVPQAFIPGHNPDDDVPVYELK